MLFDNVIVTDIDGVLLNWLSAYQKWMYYNGFGKPLKEGYITEESYGLSTEALHNTYKMFNETVSMSTIPPHKDAVKYVKKIHEEFGYVFHCISATPNVPRVLEARRKNLYTLFGNDIIIEEVFLTDEAKNKPQFLERYRDSGCLWIEDIPENAEYGIELGMRPLLMDHSYNRECTHIERVKSWKDVYELLCN